MTGCAPLPTNSATTPSNPYPMTDTLAELEDTNTRIRILNDKLRRTGEGGEIYLTRGIAALEAPMRAAVLDVVRTFDDWSDDNDPWQQHDCAMFVVDGMRMMFKIDLYERTVVNPYFIAEPLFVSSQHRARLRSRIIRSWPCASAHRLVSGESASTLFPQSVFTYAECPKTQVAHQTTTRLRAAINLPGRQPPHRWRGKLVELVSDFEGGSFRNDAVLDKAPKCYGKFPGKCNDPDLSAAHAFVGKALVPPQRQLARGLVAKPEPGQLDERLASKLCARFVDASVAVDIAAFVRAGCAFRR